MSEISEPGVHARIIARRRLMSEITERLKVAIADRYVIERELGAGGMATVYLAHDVKHDRKGPSHPALSNYARLTPEAL